MPDALICYPGSIEKLKLSGGLTYYWAKNWKNCILSWQKIGGSLHKARVALLEPLI
jgi:hypothetical protein